MLTLMSRFLSSLRLSLLIAAVPTCLSFVRAADSIPADWFVWPAVEPVSGSALDSSFLNADGRQGLPRVKVSGDHFVTPEGRRLRFWGANLSGAEAYPANATQADFIARTLAKGGVNVVRLHHLDNPWGIGIGGSIWPKENPAHRELDLDQLDRLHRLIARLRDHGIYSNLNLKVSKSLVAADGFDPAVAQLPDFQKRVDIFDRRMIDLQKDYARRLLTTKNPYTGFAPAEDPAIAFVEINNENSLLGYFTNDLGRGLDRLPEPFREELRGLWNVWLSRRYTDDSALASAWALPAAGSTSTIMPAAETWKLVAQPGSSGIVLPGADATALTIQVNTAGGMDWHLQASLHNLVVADGEVYTVEFLAKADHPRKLGICVSNDTLARPEEEWRSFGLLEAFDLGTDWQLKRLVFPAHSVGGSPASLSFNTAQSTGLIELKQLRMYPGCDGAGLRAGQSARAGSVPLPLAPSAKQWADWIQFLADTERAFAEELRSYLKDELHVQALVACSQIDFGGITAMNREQSMDYADAHSYWQHPDIPGGDWKSSNWTIGNSPQLAAFSSRGFGKLGSLVLVRVAGKPYSVSEYDHPAPGEFVCEMYPELASVACRQNWDAVYPFVVGGYGTENSTGQIRDFFDQLHHPAKWGQATFATRVFRGALVTPANASAQLNLGSPLWGEQMHAERAWSQLSPGGKIDVLNLHYAVSDRPGPVGTKATAKFAAAVAPEIAPVYLETAPQGKVWVIDSPQAVAAVGYLGGATVDAGVLHVVCPRFGRDFASVTAVALDARPLRESARVLVTLVARANNQGLVWNQAGNSVGANWGHGPTITERVPATITLAGTADRVVYALAPDGSRSRKIKTTTKNGALTFTVQPHDKTLHYEVVAP